MIILGPFLVSKMSFLKNLIEINVAYLPNKNTLQSFVTGYGQRKSINKFNSSNFTIKSHSNKNKFSTKLNSLILFQIRFNNLKLLGFELYILKMGNFIIITS